MESSLNNMSKLSLNKDVFKQKGGTLGLVILAGLFCLVAFNLPAILEWANNLLKVVVTLVATAVIVYVVLDPKVRLIASTWYMLMVKKLLGVLVKMDPISILEATIVKMEHTIANLEKSMGKLDGQRISLKDKIDEKKVEFDREVKSAKAAQKLGKTAAAEINMRQAKRLEDFIKDLMNILASTEKWYTSLSKIAEMADLTVKDAKNEVEMQKDKYKIVKTSHSAFKSAMSVINGNPDDLALFNQAWQFTQEEMMDKLGEMDRVINSAGGLMDQIDVDKEVFKINGDDLLKRYDELGIDRIFEKFDNPAIAKKAFPVEGISVSTTPFQAAKTKYF
jgi:hypothetical protein